MYQNLIKNPDGSVDCKQSIINILNNLKTTAKAVTDFSIIDNGESKSFAITFNNKDDAFNFSQAHAKLGELDVTNEANQKIILTSADNLLYLFTDIISSDQLLTNPTVPPALRIDLFEQFFIETLKPFIFYGPRADEMQVDFQPIKIINGNINTTLRGQLLRNNNTQVQFNDFDKLAMIFLNSPEKAPFITPLKQLLFAIKKRAVLNSPAARLSAISELKISKINLELRRKKLFLNIANTAASQYGTPRIGQLRDYRLSLAQTLGERFNVKTSINTMGYSAIEIAPCEASGFTSEDTAFLNRFFNDNKNILFINAIKDSAIPDINLLVAEPGEIRYSFSDSEELAQIFNCNIGYDTIVNPVIIGSDGYNYSSAAIQAMLTARGQIAVNPMTRAPIDAIRENKLLQELLNHYSSNNCVAIPPMLHGISTAAIVPNGITYDLDQLRQLFLEQNSIDDASLTKDTKATLHDGSELLWGDIWPNRPVQDLINYYKNSITLSSDRNVVENPDNPLLSLAATIASLLDSDNALTKEQAIAAMHTNNLPVQVIWSSEPRGLRLNITNQNLSQELISLLNSRNIPVESGSSIAPYKSYIYLNAVTPEGIINLEKFIFEICNYNRSFTGFERFFSSDCFRAESAPRKRERLDSTDTGPSSSTAAACAAGLREADEARALREQEQIMNFMHTMFHGSMEESNTAYNLLPRNIRHGHGLPSAASTGLSGLPSAVYTTTALTPAALLAAVIPGPMAGLSSHGILPLPVLGGTSSAMPPAFMPPTDQLGYTEATIAPMINGNGLAGAGAGVFGAAMAAPLMGEPGAPSLHLGPAQIDSNGLALAAASAVITPPLTTPVLHLAPAPASAGPAAVASDSSSASSPRVI